MKIGLLLFAVLLFTASGWAQSGAPIVIGWTGPLTGNCAVVGVDSLAAVRLVADDVNRSGGIAGRPLRIVAEDDGYVTTRAVTAYKKLVHEDGAKLIIANTYGGIFATASDALRDGTLIIDPLDCNDEIAALPENTLCLATRTESIARAFSDHIIRSQLRSVLLLVEESDGWMQLIARTTRRALADAGVRVSEEFVPATMTSFSSLLTRAKNAGLAGVVLLGNDQMGRAAKEMRELGLAAQIYGVGSILSPGFQSLAGNALESALVSSWLAPRTAAYHNFHARFEQTYGRLPALELASIPSHDVASLLVNCLHEGIGDRGDVSAGKVRECLLRQRGFPGLTGKISFDSDGAVRSIHERLYRYEQGELREAR